jgi:hypothetical protein
LDGVERGQQQVASRTQVVTTARFTSIFRDVAYPTRPARVRRAYHRINRRLFFRLRWGFT